MKEFFKNFIDGFLSALLMILIVIILLTPLVLAWWYESGWWLIVWVVDWCVVYGIASAIEQEIAK